MLPPIFEVLASSAMVKSLFGTPPAMRLFPFGEATQNTIKPYITWQLVSGVPANYLGRLPDIDDFRIQLDVWADTQAIAIAGARAVRDAIEPHAHVVNVGNTERDAETKSYRYMIDAEFFTPR